MQRLAFPLNDLRPVSGTKKLHAKPSQNPLEQLLRAY